MARRRDAATPALRVVEQAGVEHAVHAYPHDPAVASYGEEAASALGVAARRVLKTLCVEADGELWIGLNDRAVAGAYAAERKQQQSNAAHRKRSSSLRIWSHAGTPGSAAPTSRRTMMR